VDTSRVSNGSTVSEQANGHVALTDSHTDARDPDVLILPLEVEQELNESDESLGSLGRPRGRRTPFLRRADRRPRRRGRPSDPSWSGRRTMDTQYGGHHDGESTQP
jgi:hypothetical protein